MEQEGKFEKVLLRGQVVVDDGKYVGQKGQGKFIKERPYGFCYEG